MSRFRPGPSKKGKLSPYQAAKSFLPTSASACRVAQANWAYRQFAFFINPRYAIPGLCSVRDIGKPSGTAVLKSVLGECSLVTISGRVWIPGYPESPYTTSSSSRRRLSAYVISCSLAAVTVTVCTSPLPAFTSMGHFIPNCHPLPFFVWCISGPRALSAFLVNPLRS